MGEIEAKQARNGAIASSTRPIYKPLLERYAGSHPVCFVLVKRGLTQLHSHRFHQDTCYERSDNLSQLW